MTCKRCGAPLYWIKYVFGARVYTLAQNKRRPKGVDSLGCVHPEHNPQ